MVRKGLKEGLELEMRSEGIRWPLRGEPLQLVSDGFGGHHESYRMWDDQRSFKLMQNGDPARCVWDNPTVHLGAFLIISEANRKLSWTEAGSSMSSWKIYASILRGYAADTRLTRSERSMVSLRPEPATSGDICIDFGFGIDSLSMEV